MASLSTLTCRARVLSWPNASCHSDPFTGTDADHAQRLGGLGASALLTPLASTDSGHARQLTVCLSIRAMVLIGNKASCHSDPFTGTDAIYALGTGESTGGRPLATPVRHALALSCLKASSRYYHLAGAEDALVL